MYPDVVSYDTIKRLTGSFKAPMGCRSFLQGWTDPKTGKEVNAGRMNLGVITVNLPRIAMESKGDKDKFWKIFEERMRICKEGLLYKIERTKQATPESAPILYKYGAFGHRLADTDSIDDLFKMVAPPYHLATSVCMRSERFSMAPHGRRILMPRPFPFRL